MQRILPYLLLLAEVVSFHWKVLFTARYVFPYDFRDYHYPLYHFILQSFREGRFPLWDPYTYCGFPFYANLQTQVYYPPTIFAVLIARWWAPDHLLLVLNWQLVLHIFLGGACVYLLLRRMGLGSPGSLMAATIFQLGGFFASQAQHVGAVNAAAWMPLAWLAVYELQQSFHWRWVAVLASSLALAILAGFPAMAAVVWLSTGLFALLMWNWRPLAGLAIAAVWAHGLAAVQLLPAWELVNQSTARGRAQYFGSGGGVPWQGLVSMVSPNHFRVFNLEEFGKLGLPYNPTFLYLYASIGGLALALLALVTIRNRGTVLALALTVASGVWMMGENTPVWRAVYPHIPLSLKSSLYPEFASAVFLLGIGMLAGIALERFVASRAQWVAWVLVLVAAADLTYTGSGRYFNTSFLDDQPGVSPGQFEGSEETLRRMRTLTRTAVPPWRVEIRDDSRTWVNGAPVAEVPNVNGSDPLALDRMLRIRQIYAKGLPWLRYYEIEKLDSPIPDLLNVKYLLSFAPTETPVLRHPKWKLAAQLPGHQAYENLRVMPRFFFVSELRQAESLDAAVKLMQSPQFDPRRTAIVETAVTPPKALGKVDVLSYQDSRLALQVEAAAPAFLVSSETWYPGWKAWIDGREQKIEQTNVAFRGLSVPAGRHLIRMEFVPVLRWRGLAISLAAFVLWGVAILKEADGPSYFRSGRDARRYETGLD